MRQFAGGGVRIWNLSREAKAVYTCFLFMSALAFASSFALADDMVGSRGTAAYYGVRGASEAAAPRADGPAVVLPDENRASDARGGEARRALLDEGRREGLPLIDARVEVAMPYRKLLEVAHFHLFTVPVFLLIVTHLFMLTGLSAGTKLAWILAAWLTACAHIGAPFAVRYGGAGWGWMFAWSGVAMSVPLVTVTFYPVWAMWRPRPPKTEAA